MKRPEVPALVASVNPAPTNLGQSKNKRLPTELAPELISKTEVQASDKSNARPDEQAQDTSQWINKESLHQLQQDITALEKRYEEQESQYLKKVSACESQEEKELLETEYFKSRQTAKDMIDRMKRDLAQGTAKST